MSNRLSAVVGVDARPAHGRGAHEVARHVVVHRHAGEAGHLRRVAGHELEAEPDVQRRVDVLAHVEQEGARRVDAIDAVLRDREERDQHGDGRKRPASDGPTARVAHGLRQEPAGSAQDEATGNSERHARDEAQPVGDAARTAGRAG